MTREEEKAGNDLSNQTILITTGTTCDNSHVCASNNSQLLRFLVAIGNLGNVINMHITLPLQVKHIMRAYPKPPSKFCLSNIQVESMAKDIHILAGYAATIITACSFILISSYFCRFVTV